MAKEIVKHFRLTIEAAEAFSKLAEQERMKEPDYFRLLITQKPNDYPELRSGLKSLINEVNRIGVNINEIVYNNNSHLYRAQDKNRLIAYMCRRSETVEGAVEDTPMQVRQGGVHGIPAVYRYSLTSFRWSGLSPISRWIKIRWQLAKPMAHQEWMPIPSLKIP